MDDSKTYSFRFRDESVFGLSPDQKPAVTDLPVRVLGLGRETRSTQVYRWNNIRHGRLKAHVFQITKRGTGTFSWSGALSSGRQNLIPGQIFVASHDEQYEYGCTPGVEWSFDWVMLQGAFVDQAVAAIRRPESWWQAAQSSRAVSLLSSFLGFLQEGVAVDRWDLTSFGYEFLTRLLKETETGPDDHGGQVTAETAKWLAAHWNQPSVEGLAGHFGYSGKYFISWFHRQTGTTPHRFLMDHRLRRAAVLLSGTDRLVTTIAENLGFSEDNYFSKVFRRRFGVSPQEFRKRNRGTLIHDEVVSI